MYSVYQHWDPLKVCAVGRSYPPEFYSWITVPHVRSLFEKIAIETEEDYQKIISKLQSFGVSIVRTDIPTDINQYKNFAGRLYPPPMCPRDHTVMIGKKFYINSDLINHTKNNPAYDDVRDSSWPDCNSYQDWINLPEHIRRECIEIHKIDPFLMFKPRFYQSIMDHVQSQGNSIIQNNDSINGAMIARIGKDLYHGTVHYDQNQSNIKQLMNMEFPGLRNHIVNTGGHSDGTYCPVAPGLIISLHDVPSYSDTFPGWEVVYLPGKSLHAIQSFRILRKKNRGKWWIPGFEHDQSVIDTVETWLNHWVGCVEETVFDVNMLIIDPKNVMVFNYNKQVFDALDRYGITPHIVTFRHRYFWDGGTHCVTSDLHREGTMQDFFPDRS
jgi:N-dimethylarginine dimethylaminohydrolase